MVTTPLEWLSEFQVNNGSTTDQYYDSDITQLSNGNVLITWTTGDDAGAGSPNGTDIVGQIFDPLGNEVGGEFRVNTLRNADNEGSPSITAIDGGGFVITYLDAEVIGGPPVVFNYDIIAETYNATGGYVRGTTVHNNTNNEFQLTPQIASLSATNSMVTWLNTTNGDIMGRTYNPSTGALGTEYVVANLATGSGEGVTGVEIAALEQSSRYAVSYVDVDPGNDQVYLQTRSASGAPISTVLVDSGLAAARDTHVTELSNGNLVISWTTDGSGGSNSGVRARIYTSTLAPVTGAFTPATSVAGNQENTAIAAVGDNGFVVFWSDDETFDLHGQRYSNTGARIGVEFDVENFGGTTLDHLAAVGLEDGRVQITWTAEFSNGSADDVFTAIWDPRDSNETNDPADANGYQVGTQEANTITTTADTLYVLGHGGNDRIIVSPAEVNPAVLFDGGAGTDALVLEAVSGTWDFRGETVQNFEELEFVTASNPTISRYAYFYDTQITQFGRFDFDSDSNTFERLFVNMSTMTTLDLSGVIIQDQGAQDYTYIYGDPSNENITGTTGQDSIWGGSGDDTLNGGSGDDTILGGTGADSMNGGAGTDTLYLASDGYASGVTVNLGANTISGPDTISGFENVTGTNISASGDNLTGSAGANHIIGLAGNDVLTGLAGVDTLEGGLGDDRLIVSAVADVSGANVFDGGAGTDTLDWQGLGVLQLYDDSLVSIEEVEFGNFDSTNIQQVRVNADQFSAAGLSTTLRIDGSNGGGDDWLVIYTNGTSGFDASGFTFQDWQLLNDDRLYIIESGTSSDVTLTGSSGDDSIVSYTGDDTQFGGLGDDTMSGGNDNDVLNGQEGNDSLLGGNGDDALYGGDDNDTLRGGIGEDTLAGGEGNDLIAGDSGIDAASYYNADGAVTVSLANLGAQFTGASGTDTLSGIENLLGSATYGDNLTGDNNANMIYGYGGNDTMNAGGGNDSLFGGNGMDQLYGGLGDDSILGSGGNDTVSGQGGNDWLEGGAANDGVYGGANNDTLLGGTGNDTLAGGDGFDLAHYGTSSDGVQVRLAVTTAQFISTNQGTDTIFGIEGVIGSNHDDRLFGNNAANYFAAGDGEDRIYGGGGNDTMDGGAGNNDFLNYYFSSDAVNFSLANQGAFQFVSASQGTDYVTNFENLLGSSNGDNLDGDGNANVIQGYAGADNIDGAGGDDYLNGGSWNDTVLGGDGDDTVLGDYGNDLLGGGNDNDNLAGGAGDDSIYGGAGSDRLNGGTGADMLYGGTQADVFIYTNTNQSTIATRDIIQDFVSGVDELNLAGIDANTTAGGNQAFTYIGNGAFSGIAGQLNWVTFGSTTWVQGDTDGDTNVDFSIQLNGVTSLVAGDFVL
ncbi:beta strand repeat-containing protein [Primorskyibacter flagellatus]|uniref:Ca2+-binding protein, RTX toxin-related n=1 Tax=Primorskyibacter flagellatus TaxID=1387277 RepID=A0A1W1ZY86_9RHOB|nr:calcium-binding protein [Primorskyibacter flagellatus]SMC53415.1 Ca2+-binding protein, RTX toxin-related [Primorskyibacter flagellatus]